MSYLEKLKKLIGDDAFKKVKDDLGDKDLIINDGTYIPKDKFDEKLDEIKTLKADNKKAGSDLKTAQDELKALKDEKESGNKTVDQKIANLTKEIETLKNQKQDSDNKLIQKEKEALLKDSLAQAGVKNPKNLGLLMKQFDIDKLEVGEDGKIKDWDKTVKTLQEDYKTLFGEDKFSGVAPGDGEKGNAEDQKEVSTEEFFEKDVFGNK